MTSVSKEAQNNSNLLVRAATAVIIGPLILLVTYLGGIPFLIAGLAMAVLTLLEFAAMGAQRHMQGSVIIGVPAVIGLVLAIVAGQPVVVLGIFALALVADGLLEVIRRRNDSPLNLYRLGMTLAALVYAGFPPAFLLLIRALPDGLLWVYLIFAITWGTDTLAYFGGRFWGKHPLAPRISPKKTREGAAVGVVGGALLGLLLLLAAQHFMPALLPLLIMAPPVAVVGDLFESRLKRIFKVGDSHIAGFNIIPGHGGVMDRTDALIWVATLCYLYFGLIGL
jgi:phosphatidate cytidylyltransferase